MTALRQSLLALGILIQAGTLAAWLLLGAHTGWTQTRIPEQRIDPITEITFTVYHQGFKPGLDFLVAGITLGSVFLALAFIIPAILNLKRKEIHP